MITVVFYALDPIFLDLDDRVNVMTYGWNSIEFYIFLFS